MERPSIAFPEPQQVKCQSCHTPMNWQLPGRHPYFICDDCHKVNHYSKTVISPIKYPNSKQAVLYHLLPGMEGTLEGNVYRVISGELRAEVGTPYCWKEYTLYSPEHGYVWLSEYQGNWHLMKWDPYLQKENRLQERFSYKGISFRRYNAYGVKTVAAIGEFASTHIFEEGYEYEYYGEARLLSVAVTDQEQSSFVGVYMSPKQMAEAFPQVQNWPEKQGRGIAEPNPHENLLQGAWQSWLFAFVAIILLAIFSDGSKEIANTAVGFDADKETTFYVSDSFALTSWKNSVEIDVFANELSNSWVEVEAVLINLETGKVLVKPIALEYYFGSDWSEGSRDSEIVFHGVPAGKYALNCMFSREPGKLILNQVGVKVKTDITFTSNYVIILTLWGLFVVVVFIMWSNFEAARWSNSNYSPYDAS